MKRTGILISVFTVTLALGGCASKSGHTDAYDRGTAAAGNAAAPNQTTAASGAVSGTGSETDPNAAVRTKDTTAAPGGGSPGVSQRTNTGSTNGNAGTGPKGPQDRTETPSPQTGMAPKQ